MGVKLLSDNVGGKTKRTNGHRIRDSPLKAKKFYRAEEDVRITKRDNIRINLLRLSLLREDA